MTPALLKKAVYAGACSQSFARAAKDLETLAECSISSQRIRRWTEHVGNQRVEQSEQSKSSFDQMHLPTRRQCPDGVETPEVACVEMDGGRIQIRQRKDHQNGSSEECDQHGFWRESKVGCLLSMVGEEHESDPYPQLPEMFSDRAGMKRICSEIKGFSSAESTEESAGAISKEHSKAPEPPRVTKRTVIASRADSKEFGLQLAARAYELGFHAALRKAFVCDGQAANWKVWERWFSHYTPIVDFIHAVCYLYAAAMAERQPAEGWDQYVRWAQWLWAGQVQKVIEELVVQQQEVGKPTDNESTTSRRYATARALTYLANQKTRMDYPTYRRQGLPITSSHIESTIKQVNKRVKGSEKFWDRAAEAILQLSADYISEPSQLQQFWTERPKSLASTRSRRPPKLAS